MASKKVGNQIFYLAIVAFGLLLVPMILGQMQKVQYERAMAAFEEQQVIPAGN